MGKPVKAYNNNEFLNSPEARTIRMLAEYLEPERRFRMYGIRDTIVFFGSARILPPDKAQKRFDTAKQRVLSKSAGAIAEMHRAEASLRLSQYYREAEELARKITAWARELCSCRGERGQRFVVCSGGGPGIMEAANRGAAAAGGRTIGLNISLPFEQGANPFITEELSFEFHYFFIRKFWFVYPARALVIFPGGFGTIDEMMELLTLIQTGKARKTIPVILYGSEYWKSIINFDGLAEWGMISPEDINLFTYCDSTDEALEHIRSACCVSAEESPSAGAGSEIKPV